MSRCYACCQENCARRRPACDCDCHDKKMGEEKAEDPGLQCPFDGVAYQAVPGYESGRGCPVCRGIGPNHIKLFRDDDLKFVLDYIKRSQT